MAALPLDHPLYADQTLHRELLRTGIPWATVEQMRQLRQCGWALKEIADFFGVRASFVALATTHVNLNTIELVPVVGFTDGAHAHYRALEPADFVHFGRGYSNPAEGI